jgi:heme/copper-type cytochrome/quinol oxidase subunit 2
MAPPPPQLSSSSQPQTTVIIAASAVAAVVVVILAVIAAIAYVRVRSRRDKEPQGVAVGVPAAHQPYSTTAPAYTQPYHLGDTGIMPRSAV